MSQERNMFEALEQATPHQDPGGGKYIIEYERYWINWSQMELYKVKDKAGNILYHAKRKGTFGKWLSGFALLPVFFVTIGLLIHLFEPLGWASSPNRGLILMGLVFIVGSIPFVLIMLKPRHMLVYPGESDDEPILRIMHRKMYKAIIGTYTVETRGGAFLGYFSCNHLSGLLRSKMKCYGPDGSLLCTIVEPFTVASIVFLILDLVLQSSGQRYSNNPNILEPRESRIIGKFNRSAIELTPEALIDGRIYLAMGLMARSQLS
jgi:hypothetical protein